MNTLDGVKIIGLTGQSGAGKTSASKMFAEHGFPVIDADAVSRLCAKKQPFLSEVSDIFPDCVSDSGLDRQKLARIVFNDPSALKVYTSLIFPYITYEIFKTVDSLTASGERVIILDAPTLFESGLDCICSYIVSVTAPLEVKLRRILERDGIPVELVYSRIASQHDEDYFARRSDIVIKNDGDLVSLENAVNDACRAIRERFDV